MAAPDPIPEENVERISLSGVHVSITPAMREFAASRFGPLLRHGTEIVRINVRLNHDQSLGEKKLYAATGRVEIRGPDLVAHADGPDAYGALEGLAQQLDRLLRRRHGRRLDQRDHPAPTELGAPLP